MSFFAQLMREYNWIFLLLVPFIVALSAHIATNIIISRVKRSLSEHSVFPKALCEALPPPLFLILWTTACFVSLRIADAHCSLPANIGTMQKLAMLLAIGWFCLRLSAQLKTKLTSKWEKEKRQYDATTIDALGKLISSLVFILIGILIFQNLGLNLSGILAFGGIGGIAISFAAKDLLANLFGALTIHWDRPFKVGDWIRSPDKEIEGTVEQIGWRLTRIRTFDKRPLYVPNALFSTISIENPSRMKNRRIKETIGLRYQDAGVVEEVVEKIRTYLMNNKDIDTKQIMIVNFNGFNAYTLDILIYTFTKTTKWVDFHIIKQKVLMDVYELIRESGADIAFPTSHVQLEQLHH